MNKTITITDETVYWDLYQARQLLIKKLHRNISWQEFLHSAVFQKPLKSQQELLEEADDLYDKEVKKHANNR